RLAAREEVSEETRFESAGIPIDPEILRKLEEDGIVRPTPVQEAGMPLVASGRHAILQSGTGTGKTLAYLLPIFARLRESEGRAVVIAPAPELAAQIRRVVERYNPQGFTSASLLGSGNPARQVEKLRRHPRIVVGTPGRVFEMIARKRVRASEIEVLVLDEADRILSPENDAFLRDLFSRPEFRAQLVIASATVGAAAGALFAERAGDVGARVELGHGPLRSSTRHLAQLGPE